MHLRDIHDVVDDESSNPDTRYKVDYKFITFICIKMQAGTTVWMGLMYTKDSENGI